MTTPTIDDLYQASQVLNIGAPNGNNGNGAHPAPAPAAPLPQAPTLADVDACLVANEMGDAQLFSRLFKDRYIYDPQAAAWFVFDGVFWREDYSDALRQAIGLDIAAEYLKAAAQYRSAGNKEREEAHLKRAAALRSDKRVRAVNNWAKSLMTLPTGWDADRSLFTCANGVLELKTGKFRPAHPGEYLRAHSPTQWLGINTPAPLFEKFLRDIFDGDTQMINFVQRLLGFVVTGLAFGNERVFPIFYGKGANGKSTLIETVSDVLGHDYCMTTRANVLMENRNDDGNKPNPFLLGLRGKRVVLASESNQGQKLDLGLVKLAAGNDTISARGMYEKRPVEFLPTQTIILVTNSLPHVDASDDAIWDRVKPIEFKARFVDNPQPGERQKAKDLPQALKAESPGILAWLIRGALAWQQSGLQEPEEIGIKAQEYRDDEDDFGLFAGECLAPAPGERTPAGDVWKKYCAWCDENRMRGMTQNAFGRRMTRLYNKEKTREGRFYWGVKIA